MLKNRPFSLVATSTRRLLPSLSFYSKPLLGGSIVRTVHTKGYVYRKKSTSPFPKKEKANLAENQQPDLETPESSETSTSDSDPNGSPDMAIPSTPAMRQHYELKKKYPDSILLFKLGDFYEMFNDDAKQAAGVLDIALTARRSASTKAETPMCGFPCHSLDTYLERFMKRGLSVAICDQMTSAAEKKGIIHREVVRVVTPGTVYEDRFLNPRKNNYLATIYSHYPIGSASPRDSPLHLSWLDISTALGTLGGELARLAPSEIVLSPQLAHSLSSFIRSYHISIKDPDLFEVDEARLCSILQIPDMEYLNEFSDTEIRAANALIKYVEHTQKGCIPHLRFPQRYP